MPDKQNQGMKRVNGMPQNTGTLGFVIYGSPDQLSGGYFYDRALAKALEDQGFGVQWVSLDPEDEPQTVLQKLPQEVDILLYDELIHAVLAPEAVRLPPGPRHVGLVHHFRYQEDWDEAERAVIRAQEKTFCQKMQAYIVNSKHTAHQVRELVFSGGTAGEGGGRPQFLAYPSGNLWPQGKALAQKPRDQLRLFFLGNLIPRKGAHRLLEALKGLDEFWQGPWEARLGGAPVDPAYTQSLKRQTEDLGLGDKVRFLGKLDDAALEEEWSWANLFCLPSQMEGFGMVFLEASSRGIPVIGPRTGGVPEIIQPGVNGYLLEKNTPQEIVDFLLKVVRSPRLWEDLRRGSLEKAGEFGSWEETFAGLGDFLRELPGNGKPLA
jgi:glycosyltransferase involved in cell wall biosynthesis